MTETIKVAVVQLPHAQDLPLPQYQTSDAAGLDLLAAVSADAPVTIAPGARALIPTGLQIALPPGTEAQIRPRSGLALKAGVTVLNAPGTIDADYRGEIGIILINHGSEAFTVQRGDRIAQMVVATFSRVAWQPVMCHDQTERNTGGFGSTGRS